jgi:hypothetical protein
LRSRALLIANLAKDAHFKNAVQNQNLDDPQVRNDLEAAANVTAFVKLVDLAQGISDVLVQLKQLGHFLYQNQVSTVNLGLVGVSSFSFSTSLLPYFPTSLLPYFPTSLLPSFFPSFPSFPVFPVFSRLLSSPLVFSRLLSSSLVFSRLLSSSLVFSRLLSSSLVFSRLLPSSPVFSRLLPSSPVFSLFLFSLHFAQSLTPYSGRTNFVTKIIR